MWNVIGLNFAWKWKNFGYYLWPCEEAKYLGDLVLQRGTGDPFWSVFLCQIFVSFKWGIMIDIFAGPPSYPQQQPFQYGMYPPQSASIPASGAQSAAIRQGIARSVVVLGRGNRRRSWTYRLTRLAICFLIIGIALLIILGVLIVGPTINDTQLLSSRCTVISSEKHGVKSCDCGKYCTSHYPCWEIQVTYNDRGKKRKAFLYQNVYVSKNKVRVISQLKISQLLAG